MTEITALDLSAERVPVSSALVSRDTGARVTGTHCSLRGLLNGFALTGANKTESPAATDSTFVRRSHKILCKYTTTLVTNRFIVHDSLLL